MLNFVVDYFHQRAILLTVMRTHYKREYFDPNWEAKRLEPKTCLRLYVQTTQGDVGPFDTEAKAAAWMKEEREEGRE